MCPIIQAVKPRNGTLHNIHPEGEDRSRPLTVFRTLLQDLEQITLVVPADRAYIHSPTTGGDPDDLRLPTRHIKFVRLIFGMSDGDIQWLEPKYGQALQLAQLQPFLSFLAKVILFHNATFDVVLLTDIDDHVQPGQLRMKLLDKIEELRADSILRSGPSRVSIDGLADWQPKIDFVGKAKDYYIDRPDLASELDPEWSADFQYYTRLSYEEDQKKQAAQNSEHSLPRQHPRRRALTSFQV